jgi:formylglycine-generating enzyme required for sulfatase activity
MRKSVAAEDWKAVSRKDGDSGKWILALKEGVEIKLVEIPAGTFLMGSDKDPETSPVHEVKITYPILLGACEVTNAQYRLLVGKAPSIDSSNGNRPVNLVSWFYAVRFCNLLSEKEGLKPCYQVELKSDTRILHRFDSQASGYRLTTEAEWEYACRAGSKTPFFWGSAMDPTYCWVSDNSGEAHHDVGTVCANPWGVFDMPGNLFKWCHDWSAPYPTGSVTDPFGPSSGTFRVMRGGCYFSPAAAMESATRFSIIAAFPGQTHHSLGFAFAAGCFRKSEGKNRTKGKRHTLADRQTPRLPVRTGSLFWDQAILDAQSGRTRYQWMGCFSKGWISGTG